MKGGQALADAGQVARAVVESVLRAAAALDLAIADTDRAWLATAGPERLPAARFYRLLDELVERTDASIGVRLGQQARPGSFSALGYLAMSSRTLGEAVALLPRFESLVLEQGLTELETQGEQVWVRWSTATMPAPAILEDFILAAWVTLGRWLTGRELAPSQVAFRHAAPADPSVFRTVFGAELVFDSPRAGVLFPRDWLDLPVLQADAELHALMLARAEALQATAPGGGPYSRQVRALLPDLLPRQQATMAAVAHALGLSERTLRRRLADEATRFHDLLQAQRQALARHYLNDPGLSLLDIALLLGYAEHSAFTTAFRQWQGMSPQQYRQQRGVVR